MTNTVDVVYRGNGSQLEVANDKLMAKNTALEKQLGRMTAKAVAGSKLYGKSVDAIKARIQEYGREVEKATNLSGWYSATEKLQTANKELQEYIKWQRAATNEGVKSGTAAAGSYNRVTMELKKARAEMKGLVEGTAQYTAQAAKVRALAQQYDKLRVAIDGANDEQKKSGSMMGSLIGQAKSLALTYVGIQQTVTLIREEWEHTRQLQLDSAKLARSGEEANVRAAPNIGLGESRRVQDWARNNQVDLFSNQDDLKQLVGEAVSAGAKTIEQAMSATAAAMKMTIGNKEVASSMIQGGIDIMRLNKSNDAEAAYGQIRSSSAASRAINETQYIGNILGAITSMSQDRQNIKGLSTERSLEYLAVASRRMGDLTGSTSSTAIEAMMAKLNNFSPKVEAKLKDGTVVRLTKDDLAAWKAATTVDERMKLLQTNKGMGSQFINVQRQGGPLELAYGLINNDKVTQEYWADAEQKILPFNAAAKSFREGLAEIDAVTKNLQALKRVEAKTEQVLTGDREKLEGTAREIYNSIFNTDSRGNAPPNLAGIDTFRRIEMGATYSGSLSAQKRAGQKPDEAMAAAVAVQEYLKGARSSANIFGSDPNTETRMELMLKELVGISTELKKLNAAEAAKKVQRAKPPAAVAPRVVAPAAAAAP